METAVPGMLKSSHMIPGQSSSCTNRELHAETMGTTDVRSTALRPGHPATTKDPWKSVVRSLVSSGDQLSRRGASVVRAAKVRWLAPDGIENSNAKVYILERTSASSAIVSWHDPTRCNYEFQLWHRLNSRRTGVCAISGIAIKKGDSVYQPGKRTMPLNASAMILSSQIEIYLISESIYRD